VELGELVVEPVELAQRHHDRLPAGVGQPVGGLQPCPPFGGEQRPAGGQTLVEAGGPHPL
jgi:hypothetical protein